MLAALATLFASTVTLSVPTSNAMECPSPRQLTEAMNAHVPGLVRGAAATTTTAAPTTLRLAVATLPEGDVRLDLFDAQDEVLLHRLLPAPPRGKAADCPALAETVALIVERYLRDVGYEVPPLASPPPKPAVLGPAPPAPAPEVEATRPVGAPVEATRPRALWRLGVAASGRDGSTRDLDGDVSLALSVEAGRAALRAGARLSFGYGLPADVGWPGQMAGQPSKQTATLRRLAARLGAFAVLPAGPGHLEPGLGLGADELVVSRSSSTGSGGSPSLHLAPFADVSLSYIVSWRTVYIRVLSRGALSVPYDFKLLQGVVVFQTPRAYAELGLESGFAFP